MMRLRERYPGAALVTGASSGIGEVFARRLAREGFDLVVVARRADRLDHLKADLEGMYGVRVHALPCDLADAAALGELPARVAAHKVEIGLLVHAAGLMSVGPFQSADLERQAATVDVHCRAPVVLTAAFLPGMIARGRGAVLFVASIAGYQPTPLFAAYGASKAFILMFGEALWAELRGTGTDVLVVSPGWFKSELFGSARVAVKPVTGWTSTEAVVDGSLARLGRRRGPTLIPGVLNRVMVLLPRLSTRALAALGSLRMMRRRITYTPPPSEST